MYKKAAGTSGCLFTSNNQEARRFLKELKYQVGKSLYKM